MTGEAQGSEAATVGEAASSEVVAPGHSDAGETVTPGPDDATARAGAPTDTAPLTELVRDAFAVYLDKSGAREQYGDHVNVDLAFLKAHGVPMVTTLFRELATRLVPPDLKLDVPLTPRPPASASEAAQPPAPDGSQRPLSVNLDLGAILGRMFAPRPPDSGPPAAKPPESPHEG